MRPPADISGSRASRLALALLPVCVGLIALAPRLGRLDAVVTVDEPLWVARSTAFYDAFATARFADTNQTSHPGVTTMWLAGAGLRFLPEGEGPLDPFRRARLPIAIATAMMVGAASAYARRLWGAPVAAAAGVILALDPFLLAHSRVVHTDALVALASLCAILAFLGGLRDGRGYGAAGIWAGLALLTKGTSLVVPVFLAGLLMVHRAGGLREALSGRGVALARRDPGARSFALGLALTFLLLWPAAWVKPWEAIAMPFVSAGRGTALAQEANFFLGRAVRNPGPLYYPVAAALRMTPVTMLALMAGALRRRAGGREARALSWFALVFGIAITIGAKKLDRFALPGILALDVVAAVVIAAALGRLWAARARVLLAPLAAFLVAAHAAPALAIAPDYLAHFNWALGGPRAARHLVLAGGGEGLDRAGEVLNALPDPDRLTVASTRRTGLSEVFRGRVVRIDEGPADYVVFYVSSVQVGVARDLWERYRSLPPLAVIRINTVEKAWIWRAAFPPQAVDSTTSINRASPSSS